MSSSVHIENKRKNMLVLSKSPTTQGLDNSNIKFCLSLHYNGRNSFLFANATKICQFKAKDSKLTKYYLCLRIILRDF